MTQHDVCALSDIEEGGKKAFKIAGTKLLLLRSGNEVNAVHNRCAHLNLPLSTGKFDGKIITCAFHGAKFDVQTGKQEKKAWLFGGTIGGDCVKTFPVRVENGRVTVELPA